MSLWARARFAGHGHDRPRHRHGRGRRIRVLTMGTAGRLKGFAHERGTLAVDPVVVVVAVQDHGDLGIEGRAGCQPAGESDPSRGHGYRSCVSGRTLRPGLG
jgi:hypothetical protein